MSYQVLARKWRPATFEQMVGQSHVLHALTNALSQQRLHHAYLFTGTRGVGKTSLARLFAKGLNCETGITATPCGECSSCVEIAQGRFVDLIEVDAASRTKVDDTRELLDNVQYRPTRGRFKVYLIDEVHMLSRSSFNALLKTLEEPPEHVKFLLATTDPQKLPITVLSRCLQFNLKSLTQHQISDQLKHILTEEKLPFAEEALTLLAKAANGSMRDALSLTDQAIAFSAGQVQLAQVQSMLGTIDAQQVVLLLANLLKGEIPPLLELAEQILSYGTDADEVLRSLLELLHQISLTQFAPAAAQLSMHSESVLAFAQQLQPEQVQLYYQILLSGRKDLAHAPDPKSGLEMALLRAAAFLPESPAQTWTTSAPASIAMTPPVINEPAPAMPVAPLEKKTLKSTEASTEAAGEDKQEQAPEQIPAQPEQIKSESQTEESVDSQPEEDELEDQALLAEQSVLLSQAQALGYEASAESSNTAQSSTAQPNTELASSHNPKPKIEAETQAIVPKEPTTEAPKAIDEKQSIWLQILASRKSLMVDIERIRAELEGGQQDNHFSHLTTKTIGKKTTDKAPPPISPVVAPSAKDDRFDELDDLPPWETRAEHDQPQTLPPVADSFSADFQAQDQQQQSEPITDTQFEAQAQQAQTLVAPSYDSNFQPQGLTEDLSWYKHMAALKIGGRVRQLAMNSVCLAWDKQVHLLLKPDQKHLIAPAALSQLQQALVEQQGQALEIQVEVGLDPQRQTPREVRAQIQQGLLQQATHSLHQDPNIQWLQQWMGASLIEDSVHYPPEMIEQTTSELQALPLQI